VTDPPYNCDYEGGTGMKILNDKMPADKFKAFLLAAFTGIFNSLVDGGSFYAFHSDAEKVNFFEAAVEAGFHYSTTCVWVKNSLVIGRMDYQMRHEPVLYAFKDTAKHKWYSDRKQTTVWEFDRPTKSKLHPTMKPIPLIAYPIQNSSAPTASCSTPSVEAAARSSPVSKPTRICLPPSLTLPTRPSSSSGISSRSAARMASRSYATA
jgi:DNA modification methylase